MSENALIRTLLVESCPDSRAALARVLLQGGCDVTSIEHDEAAYESHLAEPYPLAVVGVDRMPDHGFWLCRRLRSISEGASPVILAISDDWNAGRLAWLLEAGIDDCLAMPPDEASLKARMATVRQRLGLCRWDRENGSELPQMLESAPWLPKALPHGIFRSSIREKRFLYVNRALVEMLGYDSEKELLEVDLPSDVHQTAIDPEKAIAEHGDQAFGIETHWKRKDGQPIVVRISGRVIRDARNVAQQFEGIVENITDQKLAQQALCESERMLRGLVENLPDLIVVAADDWTVQYINRTPPGFSQKETVGKSALSFVHVDYQQTFIDARQRLRESGQSQIMEIRDIFGYWWTVRIIPFENNGNTPGMMFICTNITEQKAAKKTIEKEQESLRQMLDLFERDRELIAFEIHDGFAQQLTGALLNFEAAQQTMHEANRGFDLGLNLLRESIAEARRLVRGLRPPVLDAFGIIPAIEHLIEDHHAIGGGQVEFITSGASERLAHPLESAVFRTVQEALNNTRKYSRSDRIRIQLTQDSDHVRVEIRDWGIGFDPKKVDGDHFGLLGIRERARLLGGTAQIVSSPGEGTQIRVEFPSLKRVDTANNHDDNTFC